MVDDRHQRGKYIGMVNLGDVFSFSFDLRNDVYAPGSDVGWWEKGVSGTHWAYNLYRWSVINNATHAVVYEKLKFDDPETDFDGVLFASFTTDDTDWDVGSYTIKIHMEHGGTEGGNDYVTYMFQVLHPSPEQAWSLTYRRLDWIRNDIENVIFPRLKRLLGFEGENLLLDLFAYDNAGNITSMRARLFDTAANCNSATPDLDPTDTPEPGELYTYTITQAHNLPRNTRTEHKSVLDYDGNPYEVSDVDVTDGFSQTDTVNAPKNTGVWPESYGRVPPPE